LDLNEEQNMSVLVVVTSNDRLGGTGRSTGLWAEELAQPYKVLSAAGIDFEIASPRGGTPPVDEISLGPQFLSAEVKEFLDDPAVQKRLAASRRLADVRDNDYDGIFIVGGFGVMWDLVGDPDLGALLARHAGRQDPIAAVCHAPAALAQVTLPDGSNLVAGRPVTGFSTDEENAVALGVPGLGTVEDALRQAGGAYVKAAEDFAPHVISDGHLHTGQNPNSSELLARTFVADLRRPTARELLLDWLLNYRDIDHAVSLFAEYGVIELPYLTSVGIKARYHGRAEIREFFELLLTIYPDWGFTREDITILIDTPDQVFAEYVTRPTAADTGRRIVHLFMGRVVARDGKIVLAREGLNTVAAAQALLPGGVADLPAPGFEVLSY
jgi:putative intracellular protease/amidase